MKKALSLGVIAGCRPQARNASVTTGPTEAMGVRVSASLERCLQSMRPSGVDQPADLAGTRQRQGVDPALRHLLDSCDDVGFSSLVIINVW